MLYINSIVSFAYDNQLNGGDLNSTGQAFDILMYIFMFVIVLVLLFLVLKFLKKQSFNLSKGRHMQLLDSLPVDNEKKLLLVEVGDKIILIGAGKELNLLTTVELNEDELAIIREAQQSDIQSVQISQIWNKVKERLPWTSSGFYGEETDKESFEQQLQEELNKVRRSKDERGNRHEDDN